MHHAAALKRKGTCGPQEEHDAPILFSQFSRRDSNAQACLGDVHGVLVLKNQGAEQTYGFLKFLGKRSPQEQHLKL